MKSLVTAKFESTVLKSKCKS